MKKRIKKDNQKTYSFQKIFDLPLLLPDEDKPVSLNNL